MSVSFCLPHPVAVSAFMICRVFSVMWSELLMTSANSCPLWSSVYECHKVECVFPSPVRNECGMFVMCCLEEVL